MAARGFWLARGFPCTSAADVPVCMVEEMKKNKGLSSALGVPELSYDPLRVVILSSRSSGSPGSKRSGHHSSTGGRASSESRNLGISGTPQEPSGKRQGAARRTTFGRGDMEAVIKDLLIGRPRNPDWWSAEEDLSSGYRKKFLRLKNPKDPEKQPLLPTRDTILMLLCLLSLCWSPVGGVHLIPTTWESVGYLGETTGRTDFCLSLQSTTSPFQTCLIGIPIWGTPLSFRDT
ncbi:uncharacterized protein LOC116652933 [Coturnix japonica]|uniref:uncharacterized protein LOC116652933 n=1 Tax=Coturnix japonica TaxID=93934 RepID=UPI0013A5F071|nr:uncharacterized protein LOC116652933 [Coturnix japonica]